MANLLLIESPGKLKKLGQILGSGWIVKASMGHVRELANDGEDALGFDLEGDRIHCRYIPRNDRAKKVLADLRRAVQTADTVYIATDPDREGETIGWHLQQALRIKQPRRVIYTEITPAAVKKAIAHPRTLDQDLVAAGRARDCLDKLVGYKGSRHVVWPLNNGAKSMGRVQSATLHLLCQREREIQSFVPQDYWSVWVLYDNGLKAFYRRTLDKGKPRASGKSRGNTNSSQKVVPKNESKSDKGNRLVKDEAENSKTAPESDRITTLEEAERLKAIAQNSAHIVLKVESTTHKQSPPPPFITSTLQQAAGQKLRFGPEKTMKVAQALYEAGHITYMRTDSVALSVPFRQAVKQYLTRHDPTNMPKRATSHRSTKGSQEAHEAIRPTDVNNTLQHLQSSLNQDQAKLYDLIWRRAVASLCCPATLAKTRIVTQSGDAFWEARGQVVEFPGYTRYWNNLKADTQLPSVQIGQQLFLKQVEAEKKQTQPPPRYTEPKLVQLMERKGIGRPSTYAPTIKILQTRTYVQSLKGKLQPTPLGLELDAALTLLLPDLIQPEFTAEMESVLDAIAHGNQEWQSYLTNWHRSYFAPAISQAKGKIIAGDVRQKAEGEIKAKIKAEGRRQKAEIKTKDSGGKREEEREKGEENFQALPTTPYPPHSTCQNPKSKIQNPDGTCQNSKSKTVRLRTSANAQSSRTQAEVQNPKSKTPCPKCHALMAKIPSKSKKMKAKHFLKCQTPGCGTVMFWNTKKKEYELPYAQRQPDPNTFTDHPCPVCGAWLEKHSYTKNGQPKEMLRCSLVNHRRGSCQEVAFFQTKNGFWSPKFGMLPELVGTSI